MNIGKVLYTKHVEEINEIENYSFNNPIKNCRFGSH